VQGPVEDLQSCARGLVRLRRTRATLIYRRTGNFRAVQLLLGHTKMKPAVRRCDLVLFGPCTCLGFWQIRMN